MPRALDRDVPPLKDQAGCSVLRKIEQSFQGPADPQVLLDDRVGNAAPGAGFAKECCPIICREEEQPYPFAGFDTVLAIEISVGCIQAGA